ncbi:MAG: sensor histidine kinase [Spirochaetaceae bacterium]
MAERGQILEAVFSAIDEVILVVDPETRTVVDCNTTVREVFGYEPEEVMGRNTKFLHVKDAQYDEFGRVSERVLDRGERYHTETEMRRKDGSVFPVAVAVVPISPELKWIRGVISVIRDITRRKRDEEVRRRNQQRLRLVTEQLPAIIWTTDTDLRITSITGRGSARIRRTGGWYDGMPVSVFLADWDGAADGVRAHETALRGEPASYQLLFDGIHFQAHVEPLFEDEGITGTVGIAHDVTDQMRYEKLLTSSVKEKEALIREIQHRVKNNLQLIKSMLALQAHAAKGSDARDALSVAERRVQSLADAHNRLLHGEAVTAVDLSDYLGSIARDIVTAAGTSVELEIDVEPISLYIDTAVPCGLIVNELVSNSIQHAFLPGREGHIRVELRKNNETISLCVRDDGVGAGTHARSRDASTGLRLVEALASQLGGTMDIADDEGTSISVGFIVRENEVPDPDHRP